MHSALFEHQQALDDEHLVRYAFELDLDAARFQRELVSHVYADRVGEDFQSGTPA